MILADVFVIVVESLLIGGVAVGVLGLILKYAGRHRDDDERGGE